MRRFYTVHTAVEHAKELAARYRRPYVVACRETGPCTAPGWRALTLSEYRRQRVLPAACYVKANGTVVMGVPTR